MPSIVSIDRIAERSGADIRSFQEDLANGVREFACGLWSRFPDRITGGANAGSSFARGYMSEMCRDGNLPPPPPQVVPGGGQCSGDLYRVTYRIHRVDVVTCNVLPVSYTTQIIPGKILGADFFVPSPVIGQHNCLGQSNADYVSVNIVGEYESGRVTLVSGAPYDLSLPFINNLSWAEVVFIEKADGSPDNCVDPGGQYPTTNPDINDLRDQITINISDNDVVILPISTTINNLVFPSTFNIGGISAEINFTGISFNFGGRGGDGEPAPLPDGQPTPVPTPADDIVRVPYSNPSPRPSSDAFDEDIRPEVPAAEEDNIEGLRFVRVQLTNVPVNVKTQSGSGAPDVVYAGWFEFLSEGYAFPRQPIHFQQNIYEAPQGATGYAYTLYDGINGVATVYTLD